MLFFSSCLYFLLILLVSDFRTFFLIYFVTVERPKLQERYQGCVEAAMEFSLTLLSEDFKGLISAHRLYELCLGPEPSELVLEKIALEERSMPFFSIFLFFFITFK